MANVDNPNGFSVVKHMTGGEIRQSEYPIASGYANGLFIGDLVALAADGTVVQAAAAGVILGVYQGCRYTAANGSVTFAKDWTTGTVSADAKAIVIDDPDVLVEAQFDTAAVPVAADVGQIVNIIATDGSTANGRSAMEADSATIALGGVQLRLVGYSTAPDNEVAASAIGQFQIVSHVFKQSAVPAEV